MSIKHAFPLLALIMLMVLTFCNSEMEYEYALIQTGEVSDIDSTGVTFHARISDLSTTDVLEYGFVWNREGLPKIDHSEKQIISNKPAVGIVSRRISTTLEKGVTYYVRAFIRNTNYVTYGNEIPFTSSGSLGPEILDFYPKRGNTNDTVYILGRNFSYIPANNTVSLGAFQAKVLDAVQDTLVLVVPAELDTSTSTITVSISGNETRSVECFTLIPPIIEDLIDKTGTYGSEITVSGKNFLSNPSTLRVFFDVWKAEISEINHTSLTAIVPDLLKNRECNITIEMNNLRETSNDLFRLDSIGVDDFAPKTVCTGERIRLTGKNFSPVPIFNQVTIGGIKAEVTHASQNELEIIVPLQDKGIYPDRNVQIEIEVSGDRRSYNETLFINDQWFRIEDAPVIGHRTTYANGDYLDSYPLYNCFLSDQKAYIGLSNNTEFWEYDPGSAMWKRLADFPGTPRWYGVGFAIDSKIYFGTGSDYHNKMKDWWEYDTRTDTWIRKSDFAGEERKGAVAFQINNTGYVGTGHDGGHGFTDFWEYSTQNDSWQNTTTYPLLDGHFGMWWGIAVPNADKALIGLGNIPVAGDYERWMYRYTPSSNSWERIANFPYADVNNQALSFVLEGKTYIKTNYTDKFYQYNEGSDSWQEVQTKILYNYLGGVAFSIGSKAYVGLGRDNQMWEYDPNR